MLLMMMIYNIQEQCHPGHASLSTPENMLMFRRVSAHEHNVCSSFHTERMVHSLRCQQQAIMRSHVKKHYARAHAQLQPRNGLSAVG